MTAQSTFTWNDNLQSGYSYSTEPYLRDGISQLADVCEHGIGWHWRVWDDNADGGVYLIRSDDRKPPYESLRATKVDAELYMRTGRKPKLVRVVERMDYSA